jgi:hypothetical protein
MGACMGRAGRTMPCDTKPMEKAIPFLVVSAFREEESCSYYIVQHFSQKECSSHFYRSQTISGLIKSIQKITNISDLVSLY